MSLLSDQQRSTLNPVSPPGAWVRSSAFESLLGLTLILTAWLWWFSRSHAPAMFGQYHDDTMLMGSAQALAAGKGYIMPGVPGKPVQTKYPIFYPWLLSLAWRWNPSFPANLEAALDVSAVFACLALVACFFLLRDLGFGARLALLLTAFCGFEPIFLVLSAKLLTDVPMMALTLAAAVVAERALAPKAGWWLSVAAGLLAAAAMLTRTIGVTIVLGVLVVALYRKRYGPLVIFLGACIPLVALGILGPGNNQALEPWARQGGPGFRQNWLFYTSYLAFWKASVPSLQALWDLVSENLFMCLVTPAMYFQFPPQGGFYLYLYVAVSIGILAGIVRHAREYGWKVIHWSFGLHSGIILCWTNREMVERFFLAFLPLFCVGFWTEGRHLAGLIARSIRPSRPIMERAFAAALAAGLLCFLARGVIAAVSYNRSFLSEVVPRRARLEREKDEFYAWVERNTDGATRFITWDDGGLYLHTGRQGMRPATFSTEYYYSRSAAVLDKEMLYVLDTARHIGARYWVRVDGEFADRQIEQRIDGMLRNAPVLFRSSQGRVRLYDVSALTASGA